MKNRKRDAASAVAGDDRPAWDAFARVLGDEPPAALRALDDAELQQLATLLQTSRRRQQQHLHQALEAALAYVPVLLRPAVRRVLFPESP